MDKTSFLEYLHNEDFTGLFTESGWGAPSTTTTFIINLGDREFEIREVAQKGFRIYTCAVDQLPPASIRRTLDAKLRKHSHAYLIIFTAKKEQFHHLWLIPVNAVDKRKIVSLEYADDTHASFLFEKIEGISFSIDEEPSVLDVISRVHIQFAVNAERITNDFYIGFRKQHDAFVRKISGICDDEHRGWYASVMLNRLMFCYFIQKKGFFMDKFGNPDVDYLQHKLNGVISRKGPNQFFGTFYKEFLRGLFESGLNKSAGNRPKSFIDKYGLIPYLNGGMFEEHQLEKAYPQIDVPDQVFSDLFKFFDEWRWHLDDRIERDGRDINPDVLGYIFEQYINERDRGNKGAFYTKEDVTGYIGRNSIIPHLFTMVSEKEPKAFEPDGYVWSLFGKSGVSYINNSLHKGIMEEMPEGITKNIDACSNDIADDRFALPLETWGEVLERRERFDSLKNRISGGKIADVTSLITANIDIQAFAEDVIRNAKDHHFVAHFYSALRTITILDPTCGSGAFLFAALNILEPLYEACLDKMEEFSSADSRLFRSELAEIVDKYRSNRQYFIYKNIILRNLFGVDLMHEATEIARLRLFLKMVAVVEADPRQENLGLDPLPDVEFNIKCGNTLVGYASVSHLKKALYAAMPMIADDEFRKIEDKAADIAVLCNRFRMQQLEGVSQFYHKSDLRKTLNELKEMLDETLAKMEYGIDPQTTAGKKAYSKWLKEMQPFHWYSEFYNVVVSRGGFDVIIGNPPYVSRTKIGYLKTEPDFKCSDLYGYVIRRVYQILNRSGHHGFIVMHNLAFSDDFKDVRKIIFDNSTVRHFSFYSRIPAGLFSGDCRVRNTIYLTSKDRKTPVSYTTRLHRWYQEQREDLLAKVHYCEFDQKDVIPMSEYPELLKAMCNQVGQKIGFLFSKYNKYPIFYKKLAYNFLSISNCEPPCHYPDQRPAQQTGADCVLVESEDTRDILSLLFCGRFYFAKWSVWGDDFHYTLSELKNFTFPLEHITSADQDKLHKISKEFKTIIPRCVQYKLNAGKYVGTYNTSKLWSLTDQSDAIFLKYICTDPKKVQDELRLFVSKMAVSMRKGEDADDEHA